MMRRIILYARMIALHNGKVKNSVTKEEVINKKGIITKLFCATKHYKAFKTFLSKKAYEFVTTKRCTRYNLHKIYS